MRPRRFRRGKPWRLSDVKEWMDTRFNEAPAIPPGKTRHRRWDESPHDAGFNEAPAIPPGKTSRTGDIPPKRRLRFNEAPAIPPGKTS